MLRKPGRFDYQTYHLTGEKVLLPDCSLPAEGDSVSSDSTLPAEMSGIPKVTGELSGLLFQIGEILEDLENVNSLGLDNLLRNLDDLKGLRVQIVKVSSELKLLKGEPEGDELGGAAAKAPDSVEADVKVLLQSSKSMITTLKNAIATKQQAADQQNIAVQHKRNQHEAAQLRERKFAFDQMITEIIALTGVCEKFYAIENDNERTLTSDLVLERKMMKASFASDLGRLRTLIDRTLNYADVQFNGKEVLLNGHLANINKLERMKVEFEVKLHSDLERFDLTDQKLKLATLTKVDIGKYSGSLEKGMDFYMFKSKFLRAYSNHPKSLLVEWLVNNHLEGKARECVGSLEDLDEIWERLKSNFGDTQELLMHQFKKITQLGPMHKQKNFELKKHYLQKLVNIMQDVYDIAVEHDLTNKLHYGNHVQKVVAILENRVQTKFCEIIAVEKVKEQHQWTRLHNLLLTELEVAQIRVSQKFESEDAGGKRNNDDQEKKGGGSQARGPSNKVMVTSELCQLCDAKTLIAMKRLHCVRSFC